MSDVTRILSAIKEGDAEATDQLLPLVYEELRHLAAHKLLHEPAGQTLQATALVHEAYLRLMGNESANWNSRGHLFGAAAEAMRRILVENARRKKSQMRGGLHTRQGFEESHLAEGRSREDLVELDEALKRLAEHNPVAADVVSLRYFGGLTLEKIAEIKGVTGRTARRYWQYARVWLYRDMSRQDI
ncbi:MAG: sigma-70 family RNA polymerase sigma factor [Planctomycetes bacterium]|nr:sigma-70 family RNA polymerase sigma factor [Planctomycetota bacterium]